jgi:hypothetical protein
MIQIGTQNLQFMMRSGNVRRPTAAEQFEPYVAPGTPQPVPVIPAIVADPLPVIKRSVLVALSGPLAGQRFEIPGPTEVGRECPTVPMSFDTMASRRHAALTPGPAGLVVSDLNSTNGTLVNGQKVSSQTLKVGDTVQIGSTTFRLE